MLICLLPFAILLAATIVFPGACALYYFMALNRQASFPEVDFALTAMDQLNLQMDRQFLIEHLASDYAIQQRTDPAAVEVYALASRIPVNGRETISPAQYASRALAAYCDILKTKPVEPAVMQRCEQLLLTSLSAPIKQLPGTDETCLTIASVTPFRSGEFAETAFRLCRARQTSLVEIHRYSPVVIHLLTRRGDKERLARVAEALIRECNKASSSSSDPSTHGRRECAMTAAEVFESIGMNSKAISGYNEAARINDLENNPEALGSVKALIEKGRVEGLNLEYEASQQDLKRALEWIAKYDASGELKGYAQGVLGLTLSAIGETDGAIELLREARKFKYSPSIDLKFAACLALDLDETHQQREALAQLNSVAKSPGAAQRLADDLVSLSNQYSWRSYSLHKSLVAARIANSLALHPPIYGLCYVNSLILQARAAERAGDVDRAILRLEHALEDIDSGKFVSRAEQLERREVVLRMLVEDCCKVGETKRARKYLVQLEVCPGVEAGGDSRFRCDLARASWLMQNKRLDDTDALLSGLLKTESSANFEVWNRIAQVRLARGQKQGAIEAYQNWLNTAKKDNMLLDDCEQIKGKIAELKSKS